MSKKVIPVLQQDATHNTADEQYREQLARLCKALAHPVRVQILRYLSTLNEACVCGDIVNTLPLAQSTVSQHLKILKEAGLIQGEIDGPRTCYYLNREMVSHFQSLVAQL
ncbi:MAG TPA: metalloregulator ArsR/SmtB family transcription factor [Ktedonobacteraceae bacterium]|nr:metalloregulator ArsR/SmtB family transcription factor [Ktedonobacteraceae bacterium]